MRLTDIERRLFDPIVDALEALQAWEDHNLGHGPLRTAVDAVGVVLAVVATVALFMWLDPRLAPPFGRYSAWGR